MTHDEIVDLWQQRPEFLNPNVKRKNTYQTYKDRAYANGWNACMREWRLILDMLDKANGGIKE